MAQPSRSAAGGVLLAIGAILGAVLGQLRGEATIGFLVGGGVGMVAAVAVWLLDRRS